VSFYGLATSVQSWSDTQITVLVPTGAATGPVDVTVASTTWYGPRFTLTTGVQVTDSKSNQSTVTAALIGGIWVTSAAPPAPVPGAETLAPSTFLP
jgi:hypothetical protein